MCQYNRKTEINLIYEYTYVLQYAYILVYCDIYNLYTCDKNKISKIDEHWACTVIVLLCAKIVAFERYIEEFAYYEKRHGLADTNQKLKVLLKLSLAWNWETRITSWVNIAEGGAYKESER